MEFAVTALVGLAALSAVMVALWLRQRRTGDAGIVDVAWSYGTGFLGAALALASGGWGPRRFLVAALVATWGARLGTYVLVRGLGKPEDGRYRMFREKWGSSANRKLFFFFQAQATWALFFALPIGFAAGNPASGFGVADLVGVLLFTVAVLGESIADRQLARFRADPANRGRVCRSGLWAWSRHPNYFFEWLHWWSYVAFAVGAPLGGIALAGPTLMLLFLVFVTGIPPAEKRAMKTRGEEYRDYVRTTSAFIPWPKQWFRERSVGLAVRLMDRGLVPDFLIRRGIRRLSRDRLETLSGAVGDFLEEMGRGPIAPVPEAANEQHYEVPAGFFTRTLGPRLKYSGCYWPEGTKTLAEAEEASLAVTARRAGIENGMDVLELGCGWGSLTLWMAEHYPASRITGVSNSASQRRFIERRAAERGLGNVTILTADMNDFDAPGRYDRVVSVEMFEHMRNWSKLLERISGWLKPDGKLFVHVFSHRRHPYRFETEGAANWMGRYFFTGGIMPSAGLMFLFKDHLRVTDFWRWEGTHYARSAEAWVSNMDARRGEILPVLAETYGPKNAKLWFRRWRVFFLACAELFGYDRGEEWQVSHYLLEPVVRRERWEATRSRESSSAVVSGSTPAVTTAR